jgi:hypothetical protein
LVRHASGLLVLLIAPAACGRTARSCPVLADVDRVVFIGDNSATAPAYPLSYARLLVANDDARFPEFAGHDLATLLAVDEVDLSHGGDSYHALVPFEVAEPHTDAPSLVTSRWA